MRAPMEYILGEVQRVAIAAKGLDALEEDGVEPLEVIKRKLRLLFKQLQANMLPHERAMLILRLYEIKKETLHPEIQTYLSSIIYIFHYMPDLAAV